MCLRVWGLCRRLYFEPKPISPRSVALRDALELSRHTVSWKMAAVLGLGSTVWGPDVYPTRFLRRPQWGQAAASSIFRVMASYKDALDTVPSVERTRQSLLGRAKGQRWLEVVTVMPSMSGFDGNRRGYGYDLHPDFGGPADLLGGVDAAGKFQSIGPVVPREPLPSRVMLEQMPNSEIQPEVTGGKKALTKEQSASARGLLHRCRKSMGR